MSERGPKAGDAFLKAGNWQREAICLQPTSAWRCTMPAGSPIVAAEAWMRPSVDSTTPEAGVEPSWGLGL